MVWWPSKHDYNSLLLILTRVLYARLSKPNWNNWLDDYHYMSCFPNICRSSLAAEMADVLGRPFTRHRRLAVSPLQSPLCGLRRWCGWRLLPWLRRTVSFGIEEEDVKTLKPGVTVVIISLLWVFSVTGLGCTILLRFNTTRSFRKKKPSGVLIKQSIYWRFGMYN